MYSVYQLNRALADPVNSWAGLLRDLWSNPSFPMSGTPVGRAVACASEELQRVTRRYRKVPFGFQNTAIADRLVGVSESVCLETPFCNLIRFERHAPRHDPKVLLIAPLSGQHASLLRDTVAQLIPDHDVYVTDWIDARLIPHSKGPFDLDDCIDLLQLFMRHLGPELHVVAISQPCVPLLAAVSLMAESGDPASPRSMTLMAGPVDARVNPTPLESCAAALPLAWFELTAVHRVPFGEPGFLRRVYPGFLQLMAVMSMNAISLTAHRSLYRDLVARDEESPEVHRQFYEDYLAVMDLPAEFYLQTLRSVFQRHELARGEMKWRGTRLVRPDLIRSTALMTIEGADDDITGVGQTSAAHALCSAIPAERRQQHVVRGVGHCGVFSGRRWREEIAPRVSEFIRSSSRSTRAVHRIGDVRPALVADHPAKVAVAL